jgi:capsular exopolysaccharide synthesis family protein
MSRNFELLQKLGKEQDMFLTDAEPIAAPEPVEFQPVEINPPQLEMQPAQLEMQPAQKDELTKLVQRLFLATGAETSRVVVVASMEAGSGSSWICARMAETLASQISASVCVVDANLGAPSLHQQFQVENHHGLSDALRDAGPVRQFVGRVRRENLWLLSCGADSSSWQSLVGSDRMKMRIAELRQEFDYVLIDAPALNTSNDAVMLGCAADGVAVVLKANSSRRETARKAMHELERAKIKVLGAVLNQRTFPIPQGIYDRL